MKRFLSLVLVAIMLLTTLMFTSCSSVKGFINKVLGREESIRTTITADEWAKITSINNFTTTVSSKYEGYSFEQILMCTADALVMSYYYDFDGTIEAEKIYLDIKRGYEIKSDEQGNWIGTWIDTSSDIIGFSELLPDVSLGDLVYDKNTKSYTWEDKKYGDLYNFYFENGNLVRMIISSTDSKYPQTTITENIGTTTVTLPEYTIEEK